MKDSPWIRAPIGAGRPSRVARRGVLMCVLCGLGMAAPASTTQAAEPEPVSIVIHDFTVSADTAVGTFESSGAIATSGVESQVFRVEGRSLHCVHTLTAAEGTIVIYSQCNLVTNVGQ